MTDEKLVEVVARAIVGPHRPVPTSSQWALDELREVRWKQLTRQEQAEALDQARAAIAAAEARIKMAADALRHADAYLMSIGQGDGTDGARIRKALSSLTGASDEG